MRSSALAISNTNDQAVDGTSVDAAMVFEPVQDMGDVLRGMTREQGIAAIAQACDACRAAHGGAAEVHALRELVQAFSDQHTPYFADLLSDKDRFAVEAVMHAATREPDAITPTEAVAPKLADPALEQAVNAVREGCDVYRNAPSAEAKQTLKQRIEALAQVAGPYFADKFETKDLALISSLKPTGV